MENQDSFGPTKKKIVIVEDEEILLELLRNKLETAGFSVDVAHDGINGLELIKSAHPDLVLLDMMLPGLNGFEILEKMKEIGLLPAMPVLIMSNSGQPIETERAVALGVRDYLIKVNFDPQEVLARVGALLEAEKNSAPAVSSAVRMPSHGDILIVEDDVLLQELLDRRFVQEGFAPVKALDADQARRILQGSVPDVILLDLVLPGTDGFVFLEELKRGEKTAHIPVVIISNLGQKEEIEKKIVKANMSPAEIVKKVAMLLAK